MSDLRERGIDGQHSAFSPPREEPSGIRVANEVEPVLVATGDRFTRFDRPDVVLRKGRYALTNGHMTPRESMVEDLLALGAALDAAEIPCLLVRDDAGRPIIAVDRTRRKELAAALATAFAEEPFYAEAVAPQQFAGRRPALLADGRLAGHKKVSAMRVYWPRVEPAGRLRYGPDTAVQLELWRFGEETLAAPLPNAVMRATMPRREAVGETVHRYGREWQTIQHMWEPLASDVTFEIDMVFSWVDGSSTEFQRERAQQMQGYVVGEGDDSEARFRQIDELKYALRSVHMYAPWVRRIFIATDSPAPAWLAAHPKVTIVRAEQMFSDPSVLPTHNSHAVEAQLHHIEGLSEHFLYSNDDMFFGRQLEPDLFFSPGGVTKFVEATTRIGLGETDPQRSGHDNAARFNRSLLRERFGAVTTRHLEHCAAPLRRSVMAEMEAAFPKDFRRTAASRFRSATDISVTNSLYHYYALMTGRAVQQRAVKVQYIETTLRASLPAMDRLLRKRDQDMFCLNDGSRPELDTQERNAAVTAFLEAYFPIPAPWERLRV
ncbi:stealth family protein [Agrococcus sp. KRD186]|uniref:stealth family protein n=1 Tax=Agrococcus sp. KRD186 TaxID=2729730 RepID=UPI0031451EFE